MSGYLLKAGVTVNGAQPELLIGMSVAAQVYAEYGHTLTITSITDGKHSTHSLHYVGLAFDCRVWDFPSLTEKRELCGKLRGALGDEFDVVLESTHIHIEFDPDPVDKLEVA